LAGPVEATALGNIAMQMVATGAVSSLADARRDRAIVSVERFEPQDVERWDADTGASPGMELTCV
jgi:rhamnulokinase/L-fuculokinase